MISWTGDPVPSPPPPRHARPGAARRAARAAVRGAARALAGVLWPEHALYTKLETRWK